jgi:hypothetical protein
MTIPKWLKVAVTIISVVILVLCGLAVVAYVDRDLNGVSPKDFGMSSLVIFALSTLALVWVPWREIGVKKIAGVELIEDIQTQNSEQIEEISELYKRIESLEETCSEPEAPIRKKFESESAESNSGQPRRKLESLSELLISFLSKHSQWSFSSSRIVSWGSKQHGFEELANYSWIEVRTELENLEGLGKVGTRKSARGNKLFVSK